MKDKLLKDGLPEGKIKQGKRVTKIVPVNVKKDDILKASSLNVYVEGQTDPHQYSHVISTIPLGCLRMVDLDRCKLSYALREALRSLQYGPSVKIGMRFRRRWWEDLGHKGGVSSTDRYVRLRLPITSSNVTEYPFRLSRMIVYPS